MNKYELLTSGKSLKDLTVDELLTSGKSLKDLTVDELLNLQKDKSLLAPELHAVTTEVVLRMNVGNVRVTAQTGHVGK